MERDNTEATTTTATATATSIVEQSLGIVGPNISPAKFGADDGDKTAISFFDTSKLSEFRVLFILGGPGAGKGTQCERMTLQYPCVHLSVGELLRAEQDRVDSPHRALIQNCLITGTIVPVDISLALLRRAMEEARATQGESLLYLVDGFPRNYDNLDGWNRCMMGTTSVWGVLMFTCPLQVLEQRILARGETSGRSDDNIQSVQKRFRTFAEQTVPIVDTLRTVQQALSSPTTTTTATVNSGSCTSIMQVVDIEGDRTVDQVWSNVQSIMEGFLANDVWTANAKLIQAAETHNEELYRQVCVYMGADEKMGTYEGDAGPVEVSNASIRFITGTKVITAYDRVIEDQTVREERVWSHEGTRGWVNIHFTRTPKQ
jgi:UMP-CMP kinase